MAKTSCDDADRKKRQERPDLYDEDVAGLEARLAYSQGLYDAGKISRTVAAVGAIIIAGAIVRRRFTEGTTWPDSPEARAFAEYMAGDDDEDRKAIGEQAGDILVEQTLREHGWPDVADFWRNQPELAGRTGKERGEAILYALQAAVGE